MPGVAAECSGGSVSCVTVSQLAGGGGVSVKDGFPRWCVILPLSPVAWSCRGRALGGVVLTQRSQRPRNALLNIADGSQMAGVPEAPA